MSVFTRPPWALVIGTFVIFYAVLSAAAIVQMNASAALTLMIVSVCLLQFWAGFRIFSADPTKRKIGLIVCGGIIVFGILLNKYQQIQTDNALAEVRTTMAEAEQTLEAMKKQQGSLPNQPTR